MSKHYLDLSNVGMRFATPSGWFEALVDVDLKIAKGEFISLIGHSGCGKSTVLNLVAGLNDPTSGGIILDGREVAGPGPERSVVFQNHALLPWLSVYENVELAVRQVMKGANKAAVAERVRYYLSLVQMDHALEKKPHEISGGMKQRVGTARALSLSPKVLLMDEPFAALDVHTKESMHEFMIDLWQRTSLTVFMITHDVEEAVFLSNRIYALGSRPGTVRKEMIIKLPERTQMIKRHSLFHDYRDELMSLLRQHGQELAAGA